MRAADLQRAMPGLPAGRAKALLPHLEHAMREFGITTERRAHAFLAQLGHESVSLRYFEEIASGAAYEGRRDLGNVRPGDGRRYKGRGPIQLTGRANYRTYGRLLKLPLESQPTLAARPEVGFRVAGLYWRSRGLNQLADRGRFDAITRGINGGFNGKTDRDNRWAICRRLGRKLLPGTPFAPIRRGHSGARAAKVCLYLAIARRPRRYGRKPYLTVVPGRQFGPRVQRAVKAFQRDNGLRADGVVGERTWTQLQTAALYWEAKFGTKRARWWRRKKRA